MSTTTDTSAIDEKKESGEPVLGPVNYIKVILKQIVYICFLVVIGALFLYTCKVAQSNLLPVCLDLSPFTDKSLKFTKVATEDINIVKTADGIFSTKITFPTEENIEMIHNALGWINDWKHGPKSTTTKLWMATMTEQIISVNFTIKNIICNAINSALPETFIIMFGAFFALIIHCILVLVNGIFMCYLWFSKMHLLFSKSTQDDKGNTNWEDKSIFEESWLWGLIYLYMFVISFIYTGWLVIPMLLILISIFVTWFPFSIKSTLLNTDIPYGVMSTIKNVFRFKLNIIMIVLSILLISNTSANFGIYSAILSIVACVILYFFYNIYAAYMPNDSDFSTPGLGDYEQSMYSCIPSITIHRSNNSDNSSSSVPNSSATDSPTNLSAAKSPDADLSAKSTDADLSAKSTDADLSAKSTDADLSDATDSPDLSDATKSAADLSDATDSPDLSDATKSAADLSDATDSLDLSDATKSATDSSNAASSSDIHHASSSSSSSSSPDIKP
jgi:hypothetical protein